jgi:hypothetical protein
MATYVEQYPAGGGKVTLHAWTDVQGRQEGHFYVTGVPGRPVRSWFREVLRMKKLTDIETFPLGDSEVIEQCPVSGKC